MGHGPTHDEDDNSVSRRTFVRAAGASSIAVGLAGCSGGGNNSGGGTDTATGTPISTEPPSEDITVKIGADSLFKNNADAIEQTLHEDGGLPDNISLEVIAGSFESGDRQAKYQQLLNAGQQEPTLLMMDNGWTIPFIARNQLANLDNVLPDSITSTVREDYFQSMVATASGQDGSLYGIPLFAAFPTVQYRKDLFREAGYSDSDFETWATEPMQWKQFSEMVAQVRDETGTEMGFNWQGKNYVGLACCDFVEFMGSWGGSYFGEFSNLFGPVGDRPVTVDEEQVVNAVRMMRTFIYGQDDPEALSDFTQCSPANVVSFTEEPSRKPFTNGNAVALRNWPYSININAKEKNFGTDLGAMPIPYHTPASESPYGPEIGGSTSALGGWHLTLNPNSTDQQKQAAVQVFSALQNDQVRLNIFETVGWIPPIPDLVNSSQAQELEPLGRYVDTLKVAGENSVPRPVTAVWPSQSSKVSEEVNASLRQEKTPTEALSSLKETLVALEKQG
ncbi:extracellular solute-binding protein [Halosegnis sp.]|uniref:extracellular solute-binding protein n=1 Tax=Halosegnis sp. TaxID=2864959 RepID=UPI0035D4B846